MEPARLYAKPREWSLRDRRPRFRCAGKAHCEFAQTHGSDPACDRAGKRYPATFAARAYRNGNRADAGCDLARARRTRPVTRQNAPNDERSRAPPGKNRQSARRLQELAAKRSTPAVRRRFSHRRRQVSKETALRPRLRLVDGRRFETGAGGPGAYQIGRASCRERGEIAVVAVSLK